MEKNIEEQFSQPKEVAHVSDTNEEVSQKDQGNQNQKVQMEGNDLLAFSSDSSSLPTYIKEQPGI